MKTSEFSLRLFDQTQRFSISEFSVLDIVENENSKFYQDALRLFYFEQSDSDQNINLFRECSVKMV